MITDKQPYVLKASWIDTPAGSMIAIADDTYLHALHFADKHDWDNIVIQFQKKLNAVITMGVTSAIISIKEELASYFAGTLTEFKTPLKLSGTPFQKSVWQQLMKIPYGQTISYAQLATMVGQPKACRAVGTANGANQLALIIPCHRVINSSGKLGGYAGGTHYKQWLIEHELAHHVDNVFAHDQMPQKPLQSH